MQTRAEAMLCCDVQRDRNGGQRECANGKDGMGSLRMRPDALPLIWAETGRGVLGLMSGKDAGNEDS